MRRALLLSILITACGGILPSFGEDPAPPIDPPDPDAATTDGPTIDEADGGATNDAGADALDAKTADATLAPSYRVFVTSGTRSGNSLKSDINTSCQAIADNAALGGKWVAWLSDSTRKAADFVVGDGPWKLVGPGGDVVAKDRSVLFSGKLAHAIDRDELGRPATGLSVWTGSDPSGSAIQISHCNNWMGTQSDDGRIGSTNATDEAWTSVNTVSCIVPAHVYCFEIP